MDAAAAESIRITDRDLAAPLAWVGQGGDTWHHVIPYRILRDIWNYLSVQFVLTDQGEFRVALRQILQMSAPKQPITELERQLDRLRLERTDRRRSGPLAALVPLERHEVTALQTLAVWPSWVAVRGPRNRSDDPGDDGPDYFWAGITEAEKVQMGAVQELFDPMAHFALLPSPSNLSALLFKIGQVRPRLREARPIPFRPAMWVRDDDGKWTKARP